MSSRPAPPGRKGSVKKGSFKGDQLADEIDPQSAAARRLREEKIATEKAAAEKAAAEKAAAEKAAAEKAAAEKAAAEKAAEEKAAAEKAAAEKAAAEKAAAEKAAAEKAAAEKAAAEKAAAEKAAAEKAAAEKAAAEKAAAEKAAAEKAKEAAEQLRILEQQKREEEEAAARDAAEAIRKRKEEEDLELARQQEIATKHNEEMRKQQEQLEEQQRRMEEKRREQQQRKEAERLAAEKAAAEEQERKEAEQAAARAAEEAADAERVRKAAELAKKLEEEEKARKLAYEEEQKRKKAEEQAEWARLEAERKIALQEAKEAEQALADMEDKELTEKRKRAEAQKKKREMFLNDMNSFSVDFETKTKVNEDEIKGEAQKHDDELAEQMNKVEQIKASTIAKAQAEEEEAKAAAIVESTKHLEPIGSSETAAPPLIPERDEGGVIALTAESNQELDTTLFDKAAFGASTEKNDDSTDGVSSAVLDDVSTLKVPTRIGKAKPSKQTEDLGLGAIPSTVSTTTVGESSNSSGGGSSAKKSIVVSEEDIERAAAAAAVVKTRNVTNSPTPSSPTQQPSVAVKKPLNEDDEEEGTGASTSISNILTMEERRGMTEAQKASWRAKQADLTTHRKDFHGVVTYAYEGIFSWQMYGSAEAIDETGTPYTEYLMRCQWGTTFDNMQPWIVAHRYKEFDSIDQKIRKQFPHMEMNMPKLPKKEMFRSLDSSVVAKRRAALEYYMSRIISSMPSIVRASLFMNFLNVKERTAAIILQLSRANKSNVGGDEEPSPSGINTSTSAMNTGAISPKASSTAVESNSKYGIEDPLAMRQQSSFNTKSLPNKVVLKETGTDEEMKYEESTVAPYLTADEAETAKETLNVSSLDEDQMGWLEIDITSLGTMLRKEAPAQLLEANSKFRKTFASISSRWPQLRATAVVGMGVDFTLIPRAMQAEEDLIRYINEFKNLETAQKLV